ncbi:hypothetical protein D3C87_1946680 [compost metagenome]
MGTEVGVDAPGLNAQVGGSVVGDINRLHRRQAVGAVLLVPAEQDVFLIGAGTDNDSQPGNVCGLID